MRLIDADAFLKEIKEYEDGCKMLLLDVDPRVIKQHIIFAPTVDQWHYPSKGELPQMGMYLVAVNVDGEIDLCIAQYLGNLHKSKDEKWYTYHERLKGYNTPIAWMPLSEPPKEMK